MNAMTLKLPDDLNSALIEVSRKRGVSKSSVVREALEQALLTEQAMADASERWVAQWRGRLQLPAATEVEKTDSRLAHILTKHLR